MTDTFAARVRQRRMALGLDHRQLARALGRGLGASVLRKIESGDDRRPRFLPELARTLGCSTAWLALGVYSPVDDVELREVSTALAQMTPNERAVFRSLIDELLGHQLATR